MKIWAHRGASARCPENTLRAFETARELGADGVELDVHRCAGGEVVVIHDADLRRVAGVPLVVRETELGELRRHDLGGGERVPLLEEVLDATGELLVNVELKIEDRFPTGLEEAVALAVRRAGAEHRVLFSCFHPLPLWRMRSIMPRAKRALIFGSAQALHLRRGWHGALLPLWAVHPQHVLVDPKRLASWHRRGLVVNTWTVNEPRRIRELSIMGVDGIITDAPDLARDALMGI